MLPLSHLLQQAEDVLSLATLETFEGAVFFIVLIREGNDVVLDFPEHSRTYIKGNFELVAFGGAMVFFTAQVGDLQFYLTELGDHIVETVAENRVLAMLEYLEVQFLKKLVLSLYELLLAYTKQNGNL